MAVIDVLPSDGKVIDEGPVGCSVDVCCDDFRHLGIACLRRRFIFRCRAIGLLR